jgi:hypothetical protein
MSSRCQDRFSNANEIAETVMIQFRRFLSRRWLLACVSTAAIVFGLLMLHPYPRQSLFGPTIRGEPWCVWEAEVRRKYGGQPVSWFDKLLSKFGVKRWQMKFEDFDDPEMVPLLIALLDDPNPPIRVICMDAIIRFRPLQDRSALPVLRKWLQNDNECERFVRAARAIWQIDRDKEVLARLLVLLDHPDPEIRFLAMRQVSALAANTPEVYPVLIAHARDANPLVRTHVMFAMRHFGQKAVPTLIDGLNDDVKVRHVAIFGVGEIGPDAKAAIPALESLLNDPGVEGVPIALQKLDPQRFQHLKAERKIE